MQIRSIHRFQAIIKTQAMVFRNPTSRIGSDPTEMHVVRRLFRMADYIVLFSNSSHFIESSISRMTGTTGQKRVPTGNSASSPLPCNPRRAAPNHSQGRGTHGPLQPAGDRSCYCSWQPHHLLEPILHDALAFAGDGLTIACKRYI